MEIEELPYQKTAYDKYNNVIQKIHTWPNGCWMVIEKCYFDGDACIPGSGAKWVFGGCDFSDEECNQTCVCIPRKETWKDGFWTAWPYTEDECELNDGARMKRSPGPMERVATDHNYPCT